MECLVKGVKLRFENQYFIYKENDGLVVCVCMHEDTCMYIFRSKYILISLH